MQLLTHQPLNLHQARSANCISIDDMEVQMLFCSAVLSEHKLQISKKKRHNNVPSRNHSNNTRSINQSINHL